MLYRTDEPAWGIPAGQPPAGRPVLSLRGRRLRLGVERLKATGVVSFGEPARAAYGGTDGADADGCGDLLNPTRIQALPCSPANPERSRFVLAPGADGSRPRGPLRPDDRHQTGRSSDCVGAASPA